MEMVRCDYHHVDGSDVWSILAATSGDPRATWWNQDYLGIVDVDSCEVAIPGTI